MTGIDVARLAVNGNLLPDEQYLDVARLAINGALAPPSPVLDVARVALNGTPTYEISPIGNQEVEPGKRVELHTSAPAGVGGTTYKWQVNAGKAALGGIDGDRYFVAPASMDGTDVVVTVHGRRGPTDGPTRAATIHVRPETRWTRTDENPTWRGASPHEPVNLINAPLFEEESTWRGVNMPLTFVKNQCPVLQAQAPWRYGAVYRREVAYVDSEYGPVVRLTTDREQVNNAPAVHSPDVSASPNFTMSMSVRVKAENGLAPPYIRLLALCYNGAEYLGVAQGGAKQTSINRDDWTLAQINGCTPLPGTNVIRLGIYPPPVGNGNDWHYNGKVLFTAPQIMRAPATPLIGDTGAYTVASGLSARYITNSGSISDAIPVFGGPRLECSYWAYPLGNSAQCAPRITEWRADNVAQTQTMPTVTCPADTWTFVSGVMDLHEDTSWAMPLFALFIVSGTPAGTVVMLSGAYCGTPGQGYRSP